MVTIALVPYCLWRAYRKKKVEMSLWNLFLVALAVLPFYIYNLWFNNQFNLLQLITWRSFLGSQRNGFWRKSDFGRLLSNKGRDIRTGGAQRDTWKASYQVYLEASSDLECHIVSLGHCYFCWLAENSARLDILIRVLCARLGAPLQSLNITIISLVLQNHISRQAREVK